MDGLTIVDHPLVQHKLTILRDKATSIQLFRTVVRETATLLCYEVTRDLPTDLVSVETPNAVTKAPAIAGKKLVFAPIMRAGLAMAEGMLDLVPSARLAHIGLYREPSSLMAVEYYFKTPDDLAQRLVIVVDPMLATGHTAIAATDAPMLAGKKLVIAPILRAGLQMAEGMLDLVPSARFAHVGLYRDPLSLQAVEYYFKTPEDCHERLVVVVDPMLATGHTAIAAIERLKEAGAQDLRFVCLLCSRPGAEAVRASHPDVPIWAAGMDEELNDHGYIVPGLGDAGDRTYGTR